MATPATLTGLQRTLDQLRDGQTLSLARTQVVRLFGGDEVAEARLRHFAAGHRCTITRADGCTVFEKRR